LPLFLLDVGLLLRVADVHVRMRQQIDDPLAHGLDLHGMPGHRSARHRDGNIGQLLLLDRLDRNFDVLPSSFQFHGHGLFADNGHAGFGGLAGVIETQSHELAELAVAFDQDGGAFNIGRLRECRHRCQLRSLRGRQRDAIVEHPTAGDRGDSEFVHPYVECPRLDVRRDAVFLGIRQLPIDRIVAAAGGRFPFQDR
jgi:hypothetical protein